MAGPPFGIFARNCAGASTARNEFLSLLNGSKSRHCGDWQPHLRSQPVAADRFLAALDETCGLLAGHPGMGQLRRELGEGVRSFPIGNYLVFYTTAPGGIDVVRVIYGGRNLPVA